MSFLSSISRWLIETLEPYGAPGLMVIAIADSSFISLPEVNDAALMALSINSPHRMWELATMTIIGSIIGCCLLYSVGRRGGEALLNRRFAADKVARVRAWYQKYGMLAVIVPSLLPPPLPFKIFVLCAGAFRISWPRFIAAVAIGRGVRYFAEGLLAVRYGKQAVQMVADNFPIFGIALASLIVAGTLIFVYMRRRKANPSLLLIPLMLMFFTSGCIRQKEVPLAQRLAPSHPFSREMAIERLKSLGQIQTLTGNIRFVRLNSEPVEERRHALAAICNFGCPHHEAPQDFPEGLKGRGLSLRDGIGRDAISDLRTRRTFMSGEWKRGRHTRVFPTLSPQKIS
jgi:membrane protein YqaA with SNARE-associated domain